MSCRYCTHFQDSKWRVSADKSENEKKKPNLRHCIVIGKYIPSSHERCPSFHPVSNFWCDKNDCWLSVEACIARKNKGWDEVCYTCWQHATIFDLLRMLGRLKKLAEKAEAEAEAEARKPKLLKRIV